MDRTLIFYRESLSSVSPAVCLWWPGKVMALFNRLPAETWLSGDLPEGCCVSLVAACLADPKIDRSRLELWNIPIRIELSNDDSRGTPRKRRRTVLASLQREIRRVYGSEADPQTLPILIDLDPPYHVTQGGEFLFRRVDAFSDGYEEGQPTWTARPAARPRRPPSRPAVVRRSASRFESLFRDRLTAAAFDFDRPDLTLAAQVFLKCCWEPMECHLSHVYYETRDGHLDIGRAFFDGTPRWIHRAERIVLRLSHPGLRQEEFPDSACLCGNPADARTFARALKQMIAAAMAQGTSSWGAELVQESFKRSSGEFVPTGTEAAAGSEDSRQAAAGSPATKRKRG